MSHASPSSAKTSIPTRIVSSSYLADRMHMHRIPAATPQ